MKGRVFFPDRSPKERAKSREMTARATARAKADKAARVKDAEDWIAEIRGRRLRSRAMEIPDVPTVGFFPKGVRFGTPDVPTVGFFPKGVRFGTPEWSDHADPGDLNKDGRPRTRASSLLLPGQKPEMTDERREQIRARRRYRRRKRATVAD